MYGRVGGAWTPSGRFILGTRLNLTGTGLGGRLEEADFLEPTFKLHLLNPPEREEEEEAPEADAAPDLDIQLIDPPEPTAAEEETSVVMVVTPVMFAQGGLFLGAFSNAFAESLRVELFQAYVEATNVVLPGLDLWAGVRYHRGTDIHIADYYFFNDLSGQGAGARYGALDVAVLLYTARDSPLYAFDSDADGTPDARRHRTVLAGQYVQRTEAGHALHFLGELHLLPGVTARTPEGDRPLPADHGWVLGVKGRLDLGGESLNELSVRYGRRIANGSQAGARTWQTFGEPDATGRYTGARGLEVVDHFFYNFGTLLALDAYATLHYAQGASATAEDRSLDFTVGERTTLFVTPRFHLIHEASLQGLRAGEGPWATAVKLTLMPTVVPSGVLSGWARPHLRLFYTVAFYDRDAVALLTSPYLQATGAASTGHYLGVQVEWWL
jgi:maltoporin